MPRIALRLLTALLCALALCSCAQQLADAGVPGDPGEPGTPDAGKVEAVDPTLGLLPESPRYFEYKGLPMVFFGHQGGLSPVPTATLSAQTIVDAFRYGNSLFTAAHPQWVNASYGELLETLQDDAHWEHLERLARAAFEHDVILRLYFWSYKWNYADEESTATDMLWPDPQQDGGEAVDGWTRRELHELAIERVVEATWRYPNVVYNFMWEYNTKRSQDPDGHFHRWWVGRLREAGRQIDPGVPHLVSIEEGRPLPGDESADFSSEHSANFVVEGCSMTRSTMSSRRYRPTGPQNVLTCSTQRGSGTAGTAGHTPRPTGTRKVFLRHRRKCGST